MREGYESLKPATKSLAMKSMSPVIFCSLFLVCFAELLCAQNKYPVATIAPALLKDAHVVKRMEESSLEIVSLTEAVYKHKYALTILDEAGQRHAGIVEQYDKLQKINTLTGALYDAAGNQLKKVKGKEINDYSAISDISLFEDNRIKVHDFNYGNYPYTVEYEVETEFNNTYGFPDFTPQLYEHASVEKSSFTFIMPEGYGLRYKAFNYATAPVITSTLKGKKVMTWEVKNLPAITRPFASPPWHELTPTVMFAPTEFQLEGFKGDASSWASYGKFQLQLNQNRDVLPPNMLTKVQQLTTGIADPKEKVRKLYEFMQSQTRYISIQLGIGGLQPFEAGFVAQKGYGDCKALSNYMYSLLKAAGIPSYYTTIRAGESTDDLDLMEDFPSHQSNHIVLCVPLAKDTVWLECTSQSKPAGYMGGFTGNRKALAITEEGGKLIATPHYGVNENLQVRKIKSTVDEEGNLSATVYTSSKAMRQDDKYEMINALSKEN